MKDLIERMNQYAMGGLKELSEHPVRTTKQALTSLVKDYWDLGLAIASGLALTDYGKEFIGDQARFPLYLSGGLVSLTAPLFMNMGEANAARAGRNAMALFGSPFVASGYTNKDASSMYTGIISLGIAALADYMRVARMNKAPMNHESLETEL